MLATGIGGCCPSPFAASLMLLDPSSAWYGVGEPPRDALQSLAPGLLQSGGFSCDLYELFIVFSLLLHFFDSGAHDERLQEPAVTHLYEHFMNPLFEIYGFGYPMI